jgi:hypothetical protein
MVETVVRAVDGPVLRFKVTAEVAPLQVMVNDFPTAMPLKSLLVNWTTALATEATTAPRMNFEKRILGSLIEREAVSFWLRSGGTRFIG